MERRIHSIGFVDENNIFWKKMKGFPSDNGPKEKSERKGIPSQKYDNKYITLNGTVRWKKKNKISYLLTVILQTPQTIDDVTTA